MMRQWEAKTRVEMLLLGVERTREKASRKGWNDSKDRRMRQKICIHDFIQPLLFSFRGCSTLMFSLCAKRASFT